MAVEPEDLDILLAQYQEKAPNICACTKKCAADSKNREKLLQADSLQEAMLAIHEGCEKACAYGSANEVLAEALVKTGDISDAEDAPKVDEESTNIERAVSAIKHSVMDWFGVVPKREKKKPESDATKLKRLKEMSSDLSRQLALVQTRQEAVATEKQIEDMERLIRKLSRDEDLTPDEKELHKQLFQDFSKRKRKLRREEGEGRGPKISATLPEGRGHSPVANPLRDEEAEEIEENLREVFDEGPVIDDNRASRHLARDQQQMDEAKVQGRASYAELLLEQMEEQYHNLSDDDKAKVDHWRQAREILGDKFADYDILPFQWDSIEDGLGMVDLTFRSEDD